MILNSPYISGSLTVTGNTTIQGQLTVTGSLSGTASLASNALLLQGTGSTGFATTASINEVSASQQSISASLLQVSASYIALSGSYNTFSGSASTRITENSSSIQQVSASQQQISSSQQQISSSQQQISASLLNVIAIGATTGSNSFRANQSITGSLVVSSTITAQTLVVQTVTSSIVYSSGSNVFGCDLNSRQTFTGSVNITGSLTVNTTGTEFQVNNNGVTIGNLQADNHSITGSLRITGSLTTFSGPVSINQTSTYSVFNLTGTDCGWGEGMVINPAPNGYSAIHFRLEGRTGSCVTCTWQLGKETSASCFGELISLNKQGLTGGSTYRADASQQWKTNGDSIFGFNVGIGTCTPANKLTLSNNGNSVIAFRINDTNANASFLSLNASNTDSAIIAGGTSAIPFDIYTCGVARMRITAGGITQLNGTNGAVRLTVQNTDNAGYMAFTEQEIRMWRPDGSGATLTIATQAITGTFGGAITFSPLNTERMRITGGGIIYALNAGVDGTYQPMIGGMYSANNNETNLISTAVSSVASQSGFRFDVSNGAGSSARTTAMTINRSSVTINGSLSKGSGTFNIEHPLESKKCTHRLVHSFIEGPQADLIYRGKINLDNGIACVNIDRSARMTEGTFEALNRCAQVFTTNESSWDAIKGKLQGNILVIESQNTESNDEISWMVIGERQDKHIKDTSITDSLGRIITEPEVEAPFTCIS